LFNKVVPSITGEFAAAYENFEKDINIALVEATDQLSAGQAETEADSELQPMFQRAAPITPNPLCVSSEAVCEMRAGPSMGGLEQPPPSNRLHAALF